MTFSNLTAQKKVTKNVKSNNVENTFIHLKFAQNIIVKNWNKNEVLVEASVNLNDNTENEKFSLESTTNSNT